MIRWRFPLALQYRQKGGPTPPNAYTDTASRRNWKGVTMTNRRRPSPHAWRVVTGEDPIPDSKGDLHSATLLIFSWYRDWLHDTCQRDLTWRGTPLEADFQWLGDRTFNGRTLRDVAEELQSIALTAAAEAVDLHRPERGPMIPWMKMIIHQRLSKAFRGWARSSSSVNADREDHATLNEERPAAYTPRGINRGSAIHNPGNPDIRATHRPDEGLAPALLEPAPAVDRALVATALAALTEVEAEALRRFADGENYYDIERNMGLSHHSNARRIVQRAQAKAREALA
jgi:hypothetical protein